MKLLFIFFFTLFVLILVYKSVTVNYPAYFKQKNPNTEKDLNFQLTIGRVFGSLPNTNYNYGADEVQCLQNHIYQQPYFKSVNATQFVKVVPEVAKQNYNVDD